MAVGRDWSEVPQELVEEVILKIGWPEDVISLSCVCRAWFSAFLVTVPKWRPANPWLLLSENTKDNPECIRKVYNPGNNKFYNLKLPQTFERNCWGSDLGWVVTFGLDLEIRLFNPLTKRELHLPPFETMMPQHPDNLMCICQSKLFWMRQLCISKACVLKTSKPIRFENDDDEEDDDEEEEGLFVAVIHIHKTMKGPDNSLYAKSTYLSIGRPGDRRWILVDTPGDTVMVDVTLCKDRLWYVDVHFSLWYVDLYKNRPNNFEAVQVLLRPQMSLKKLHDWVWKLYLSESYNNGQDLLLVVRFVREMENLIMSNKHCCQCDYRGNCREGVLPVSTKGVFVYKLINSDSNKMWELVKPCDLGETTMFIGKNTSMLVGAPKMASIKSNCIYLADDYITSDGRDMGLYYLDSHKMEPFSDATFTHGRVTFGLCNPFWFTPRLY